MRETLTIHPFEIESIDGTTLKFSTFTGKKILIVNVASECGYTPQYAQLQELYNKFQDKLVIIACPSNDFGGQEPDTAENIQKFCSLHYNVTFPLTTKLNILHEPHPLYQWLTQKELNGKLDSTVKWNFQKYLLDEQGELIATFPSSVTPIDAQILDLI